MDTYRLNRVEVETGHVHERIPSPRKGKEMGSSETWFVTSKACTAQNSYFGNLGIKKCPAKARKPKENEERRENQKVPNVFTKDTVRLMIGKSTLQAWKGDKCSKGRTKNPTQIDRSRVGSTCPSPWSYIQVHTVPPPWKCSSLFSYLFKYEVL